MNTFVALLRGINVGGKNKLPMRDLVALLESLKLLNVKTYIQSGNAVFQTEREGKLELARDISSAISKHHGFTPQVLILELSDLKTALANNPFPAAGDDPKTLHLFFLAAKPTEPSWARLESLKTTSERYKLVDDVFYLHAPDGVGRSKLFANIERALGVPTTARNWRSANKILALAELQEGG